MAHRYLPIYDTEQKVGPAKPNLGGDVKLVQALIWSLKQLNDPVLKEVVPVPVTGIFTPPFAASILQTQKSLHSYNPRYVVDGVIDPLPSRSKQTGDWDRNYMNGAESTLLALNYRLFRIDRNLFFSIGETHGLPWKPDPFATS